MKIYFLGTQGWYTSPEGDTPCILIDSKDRYVIFDAGNAIYKLDRFIKEKKPISLFLTHFHIDHVSGLHVLIKFAFPQGVDIYVAKGRRKDFDLFVNPPYTVGIDYDEKNILNYRMKIRLHELEEGKSNIGFSIFMKKLFHGYINHGFRVDLEGKSVVYSGDTKPVAEGISLAKNADLLIHECSNVVSPKADDWGHTDPTQAAEFAKDCKVKKLVLTHFGAEKTLEERKQAEKRAKEIFPNTIAATDDLTLEV